MLNGNLQSWHTRKAASKTRKGKQQINLWISYKIKFKCGPEAENNDIDLIIVGKKSAEVQQFSKTGCISTRKTNSDRRKPSRKIKSDRSCIQKSKSNRNKGR